MALTGHLSDLSLSELIEFFCNQRKTGCLKVRYPHGPGYFHLQAGSVVDAQIGVLRGIDAVYYALTLPNASFEFSAAVESPERTINQPWTQVVLEGLRRLDEGMVPPEAFPVDLDAEQEKADVHSVDDDDDFAPSPSRVSHVPSFLSMVSGNSMSWRKPLIAGAAAVAVMVSVAAIGVPAGWYGRKAAPASGRSSQPANVDASGPSESASKSVAAAVDSHTADAAALAAKRQHEKEKAKAREEKANAAGTEAPKTVASTAPNAGSSGPKKVVVQVTYDESGRVVQASGADPTALRIARQKRFPPGKAGTATITIPIN